jgi:hypothetical protein
MSQKATLGVLTEKLSPNGQQRLFEFLDAADTASAGRFRAWLGEAADGEIASAADMLNRASHGNQFMGWWRSRDRAPVSEGRACAPPIRTRGSLEHAHSQARARSANGDLTAGGISLGLGLLVTLVSYTLAEGTGGFFIVATGAILYGGARLVRGLIAR